VAGNDDPAHRPTGAHRARVTMAHTTKAGEPEIAERCTDPLTGLACVSRIDTDLAVIGLTPAGARVVDRVDGIDFEQLQARTGMRLGR
jgi:3-oxoadipate CoA-transferase beta subunit